VAAVEGENSGVARVFRRWSRGFLEGRARVHCAGPNVEGGDGTRVEAGTRDKIGKHGALGFGMQAGEARLGAEKERDDCGG
jgi:hypothetical protein